MKKQKFAVVGCGRIASRHVKYINNQGALQAVCDVEIERAVEFAKANGVNGYGTIEEMLEKEGGEIDVVSICSPNGLHAEHTIMALEAGCHVLCEKPMANSVYDCGLMIQAAERNNKRLFIIKQNRFNPPVIAVKNAISLGTFGKLYSIQLSCFWNRNEEYYRDSWKGSKDIDGGTLYTQFSHFIDLIYWMIGDVKKVKAFSKNFHHQGIIEFEDTGVVILEFYNGVLGTINYTVNSFGKNMEGSLTIFGENGTVKIGGQYLNELEYQNIKDFKIENLPEGNKANNYGHYQGSMSNHGEVYSNLIDVLNNGASISTSFFEGLKTVEIIDRIYQEMRGD